MPLPTINNLEDCSHCDSLLYAESHLQVDSPNTLRMRHGIGVTDGVEDQLYQVAFNRARDNYRDMRDGIAVTRYEYYAISDAEEQIYGGELDSFDPIESDEAIHGYSYRPRRWTFHGDDSPVHLGMELEVEARNGSLGSAAYSANEYLDHGELGFLKEDGSIRYGFEIVTQPMTYSWAILNFPWQMLGDLWDRGLRAERTCGIHIHIARAGFNDPTHLYKWQAFLYRNRAQIERLARRGSVGYASWSDEEREQKKARAKGQYNHQRYVALNFQNPDTIEARFFRATLDPGQAQAALGLIDASVEYTRQLSLSDITHKNGWSFRRFAGWATKACRYDTLCSEIHRRVERAELLDNPESIIPRQPHRDYWTQVAAHERAMRIRRERMREQVQQQHPWISDDSPTRNVFDIGRFE